MAREVLSDDERWRLWWNEDFSWDGLAKRDWLGWRIDANGAPTPEATLSDEDAQRFRQATLQDYWRDQEATLVNECDDDGNVVRRWTRLHLPPAFENGTPSGKHSYAAQILEIVKARLASASETPGQYGEHQDMIRWWPDAADGRAMLEGCVLPSFIAADLHNGPLHVRLSGAVFLGSCICNDATFGAGAEFHYARFMGDSHFKRAIFNGFCAMGYAQFARNAEFFGAQFKGGAEFFLADFSQDCAFDTSVFEGEAQFSATQVSKYATFSGVHFHAAALFAMDVGANANFSRAQFDDRAVLILDCVGRAYFEGATFAGVTNFGSSVFNGSVNFVRTEFPKGALLMRRAFRGTRFKDQVDFSGAGAHWTYGLHGASIESNVLLDDVGSSRADAIMRNYFSSVSKRETIAALGERAAPNDPPVTREVLLREFEDSCRVLKAAMGRMRNEVLEQRYYRYQLIARRRQSSAPLWERLFSLLYGAFGDYGNSMFRPIATLIISLAVFGFLYFVWAGALGFNLTQTGNHLLEAMKFSLSNTFRPLSALDSASVKGGVGAALGSSTWWSFWFKVAAVLQSLLALALVFLFALAVRRRFQMH